MYVYCGVLFVLCVCVVMMCLYCVLLSHCVVWSVLCVYVLRGCSCCGVWIVLFLCCAMLYCDVCIVCVVLRVLCVVCCCCIVYCCIVDL